jgi:heptosyltransferase-2
MAKDKWLTGLFDDLNKRNPKSYVEEIFEMAGFEFQGEKYILEQQEHFGAPIEEKAPLIGLNTGCGEMWPTRLWSEEKWIALAKALKKKDLGIILLGGPNEDEKNKHIREKSGASYLGHFPLKEFISLIGRCDLIVTSVTLAMHIAIGLEKKLVVLNNIFNKYEFELYGLGQIVEPNFDCLCCFKRECGTKCLETISVDDVVKPIMSLITDQR